MDLLVLNISADTCVANATNLVEPYKIQGSNSVSEDRQEKEYTSIIYLEHMRERNYMTIETRIRC